MNYKDLINKLNNLTHKKEEIMERCAKEGRTFNQYTEEVSPIVNEIYTLKQDIRLIQAPVMQYGKEWNGVLYTMEDFINNCKNNTIVDEMGSGYYATENAKSDIKIYVTDIIDNKYRTDFTHVLWFE